MLYLLFILNKNIEIVIKIITKVDWNIATSNFNKKKITKTSISDNIYVLVTFYHLFRVRMSLLQSKKSAQMSRRHVCLVNKSLKEMGSRFVSIRQWGPIHARKWWSPIRGIVGISTFTPWTVQCYSKVPQPYLQRHWWLQRPKQSQTRTPVCL